MAGRLVSLCFVVAYVVGAPAPDDVAAPSEHEHYTVIPIVAQTEGLEANGTFKFSYETGNGIKWEEISYDKTLPKVEGRSAAGEDTTENNEVHVQQGSYSYTAPDGTVISLRYIADENGFQPVGDHIPTPPTFVNAQVNIAREKTGRALNVEAPVVPAVQKVEPNNNLVQSEPKIDAPVVPVALEPVKPAVDAAVEEKGSSETAPESPKPSDEQASESANTSPPEAPEAKSD